MAHLRREHEERHAGLRSGCPAADPGHEGREQEQQEQQEQQKQKQKQKQEQQGHKDKEEMQDEMTSQGCRSSQGAGFGAGCFNK